MRWTWGVKCTQPSHCSRVNLEPLPCKTTWARCRDFSQPPIINSVQCPVSWAVEMKVDYGEFIWSSNKLWSQKLASELLGRLVVTWLLLLRRKTLTRLPRGGTYSILLAQWCWVLTEMETHVLCRQTQFPQASLIPEKGAFVGSIGDLLLLPFFSY